MLAHPPDSQFYEDVANATLWRDLSRLFEDFLPNATKDERRARFQAVLSDIDGRLSERTQNVSPISPRSEMGGGITQNIITPRFGID